MKKKMSILALAMAFFMSLNLYANEKESNPAPVETEETRDSSTVQNESNESETSDMTTAETSAEESKPIA